MTITQKLSRLFFLPILILVAVLTMYVRTSQVVVAVESGALAGLLSPAPAVAETKPAPSSPKRLPSLLLRNPAACRPATRKC